MLAPASKTKFTTEAKLHVMGLRPGAKITNKLDIPFLISVYGPFCDSLDHPEASIRHMLQDLITEGWLIRTRYGVYRRTEKVMSKRKSLKIKSKRPVEQTVLHVATVDGEHQPLHPAAPVLTKEKFDELRKAKTIGPQTAYTIYPDVQEYMDSVSTGFHNRPLRPTTVKGYAERMARGEWRLDGNVIQYDWNGQRINGQHRGEGCKRSGHPYAVYMSFGHDPENYKNMDQHAKRDAGDLFAWNNWVNPKKCAYTAQWLCRYYDGLKDRATIPSDYVFSRAVGFGQRRIEECVSVGLKIEKRCKLPAQYVAMVYFLARKENPEAADAFFHDWAIGGTETPTAARKLVNQIETMHSKAQKAVLDTIQVAMMINAWNAYVTGRNPSGSSLMWSLEDDEPVVIAGTKKMKKKAA